MLNSILMNEENAHKIIKKRILATWIDIFLFITPIAYINNPIVLLIFPLNYVVLPYSQGYTIGMLLMRIRIVNVPSDEMNKLKVLQLLSRSIYFYTMYPWENILSRGIVRISQIGQTKLDQKFNTSVVFKDSIWDQNTHAHTYESYLHHVIFFAILIIYFVGLLSFEIINNFIK
jgi:hypothetical protein